MTRPKGNSGRRRDGKATNKLSSSISSGLTTVNKTVDEQSHQLLQLLNNRSKPHPQPQDNTTAKKPRINEVPGKNDVQSDGNDVVDHQHFDDRNNNAYYGIDLADDSMYEQQQHHNITTTRNDDVGLEAGSNAKDVQQQVSNGATESNINDNYDFDENVEETEVSNNVNEQGVVDDDENKQQQQQQDADVEQEPDWDSIALHEPSKTDVPVFLSARDRKDAADDRFAAALDECHSSLKEAVNGILSAAAEIYNIQREKIELLELEIKQHFVSNEEARDTMQRRLEESANAAQGLFAQLLQRVSQPLLDGNASISSSAQMMLLNQQQNIISSISNNITAGNETVPSSSAVENNINQGTTKSNNRHQRPTTASTFSNRNAVGIRKGKTNQSAH